MHVIHTRSMDLVFLLLLIILFLQTGCGQPSDEETLAKFQTGMTLEQVEEEFGHPSSSTFSYPLDTTLVKHGPNKNWTKAEMKYSRAKKHIHLLFDDTHKVVDVGISDK